MVFPAQLVTTLAQSLDVPVQTVAQHDRLLAVSGHRTTGGRGRSSARVTPMDAANLIIAVVGAPVSGPMVKDSAANLERYASLPACTKRINGKPAKWSSELKILQRLAKGHSFRDALAALITTFSKPDLGSSDVFGSADGEPSKATEILLSIELHSPRPEASITITGSAFHSPPLHVDDKTERLFSTFHHHELFYNRTRLSGLGSAEFRGDLHQIRTIGEVTIKAIANLFKETRTAEK